MNTLYEIVAYRPTAAFPSVTPAVQIAVDRWLVADRQPALPEGFAVTDVTGKWQEMRISAELLSNTVDAEQLLADRSSARTVLFDCPAILHKVAEGYAVWIERSYAHAFDTAVQQVATL
jgi:hypothetical protein